MAAATVAPFDTSIPPYTPSQPAPGYSDLPYTGEQSLQYTPRVGSSWFLPDGTFIRRDGHATLVLYNQEDNTQLPEYRQSAIISGCVELKDMNRILKVTLHIEGRIDTSITEGGRNQTVKTIQSTTTLWAKKSPGHPSRCPSQLAFAYAMPAEYEDATGLKHPLPPSFQTIDMDCSGVFARTSYRLRISVTRKPKIGLFDNTKHIFVPFAYKPRSRSRQPITCCAGSVELIKALPDEWYQTTTGIEVPSPKGSATFQPVHANLLIPNPRVFAMGDSVPFHLQLAGRVDSLKALVTPDTHDAARPSSRSSTWIKKLQGDVSSSLRVFLLRQVRVEIGGTVRVQNIVVGEAELDAVPPDMTDSYRPPVDSREEYISWKGQLKLGDGMDAVLRDQPWQGTKTDVAGFSAGSALRVTDFVALSVGSSNPPWKDVKASIPIKFVTESWDDVVEVDNQLFA